MTSRDDMLVVAERLVADELAARVGPGRFRAYSDPYDALGAMRDRRWATILLTASQVDLDGLCRAVRRLQRDARLLVLCAPSGEPRVRPLKGKTIDDYFIYPLMESDWEALSAEGSRTG